jgi:hypothetical protein
LVFIASNSLVYETPTDDPLFSAHSVSSFTIPNAQGLNKTYYESDKYIGIIGCAEQHQVCHGDTCTPLSSSKEVFPDSSRGSGLSTSQRGLLQRLGYGNVFTGIANVINSRSGRALRASETVRDMRQASLPSDQWQIELSFWFSTGLAMFQLIVQEYATPSKILPGSFVEQRKSPVEQAMCSSQKTLTTKGTISFSILGLAVILIVGTLLILTSFILETVVGWMGLKGHQNWVMDDKLQLQRMVFEGSGVRWTNTRGLVPVTEAREKFPASGRSAESESLMAQDQKTVGINVTEVR